MPAVMGLDCRAGDLMGKSKGAATEPPFPYTGVLGVTCSPFDLPVPEVHSRAEIGDLALRSVMSLCLVSYRNLKNM